MQKPSRYLGWVVLVLSAGVIWVRAATVHETYQYVRQQQEYRQLQQEIQASRVKWLRLTTPRHLESLAAQLKLKPGDSHRHLKYEPDTSHTAIR